jgi:hypothetical protein|tara:strand:+ start:847 stop:1044 length:198 start_codon:yes stop_codon:yes gene_type:complete
MDYKPYSPQWTRKRYLKEALESYLEDGADVSTIYEDILDILNAKASSAIAEYDKIAKLTDKLSQE